MTNYVLTCCPCIRRRVSECKGNDSVKDEQLSPCVVSGDRSLEEYCLTTTRNTGDRSLQEYCLTTTQNTGDRSLEENCLTTTHSEQPVDTVTGRARYFTKKTFPFAFIIPYIK